MIRLEWETLIFKDGNVSFTTNELESTPFKLIWNGLDWNVSGLWDILFWLTVDFWSQSAWLLNEKWFVKYLDYHETLIVWNHDIWRLDLDSNRFNR